MNEVCTAPVKGMGLPMRLALFGLLGAARATLSPLKAHVSLRPDPCVRLLNLTGTIGCATRSSGSLAELSVVRNQSELSAFLASAPTSERIAIALTAALFERSTLQSLADNLGAKLEGVLVLHASEAPAGGSSPAASLPLWPSIPMGSGAAHAWNAVGSDLSLLRFPFGIILLDAADSRTILRSADASDATSGSGPALIEMRYPMEARTDARACLEAGTCLPLGGQSVWGALSPRTAAASGPESTPMVRAGRPIAALTAQLDASAFFHETAPGAYEAVSSTVALLAAIDSISSSASLANQLPALPSTPLFFLFTGEAWGLLGSRRFLTDVRNFTCTERATPPPSPPPATPTSRKQLPAPQSCSSPFQYDLRFTELRAASLASVLQIGPLGASEAKGTLYVHAPSEGSQPNELVATLHEAAAQLAVDLRNASGAHGLPPGAAQAFADPKVAMRGVLDGTDTSAGTGPTEPRRRSHIATLSDFDLAYRAGARFGSRFDTIDGLDVVAVCTASELAARSWWKAAGGHGQPSINCTLVRELLGCLLPPPLASSSGGDGGAEASEASGGRACPLAAELGVEGELHSHYTGVFLSSPGRRAISTTARFAQRWLERSLAAACEPVAGSAPAACEPNVVLHDAYGAGLALDEESGRWRVVDTEEPLWAESNWPAEMYAIVYPYGAPRVAESLALLGVGLVSGTLTYLVVVISRRQYQAALDGFKRL